MLLITHNFTFMEMLNYIPFRIREHYRALHVNKIKERVEESIFFWTVKVNDFAISQENEPIELYQRMADQRRQAIYEEIFGNM